MTLATISPEEYANLPPSIQKKYFSSQERFQITQRSAAEKRQRQQPKNRGRLSESKSSYNLSSQESSPKPTENRDIPSQRRSSLPSALQDGDAPSPPQQAWYQGLPDKVKRSQFSKEERAELNGQCSASKCRLPTSVGHKFCPKMWATTFVTSRSTESNQVHSSPQVGSGVALHNTLATRDSPEAARAQIQIPNLYARRKSQTLNGRAGTAHPQMPSLSLKAPNPTSQGHSRQPSHRSFNLRPLALPPPVLAPVLHLPSPETNEYLGDSNQLGHQPTQFVDGHFELTPEAKPYNNPETHATSRHFISVEHFDEAIMFGFSPSDSHKPSGSSFDPLERPRTASPMSLGGASFESHGPITPTSQDESSIGQAITKMSNDSDHRSLHQLIREEKDRTTQSKPYLRPSRDMTIRMTLNRPDLRASIKHSKSFERESPSPRVSNVGNYDPYALEALPVCDDPTGAHGAFAINDAEPPKSLKHVFRGFRRH